MINLDKRKYGIPAGFLFFLLMLVYGRGASLSKLKALETITHVLYQTWEQVAMAAMTHTYIWPDFARRVFKLVNESKARQESERQHLLILEEMLQKSRIQQNIFLHDLISQILASFYHYWSWVVCILKPVWAYRLMIDLEDCAEHAYLEFVRDHPQLEQHAVDLLRKIALDERLHKEESLARMESGDFS